MVELIPLLLFFRRVDTNLDSYNSLEEGHTGIKTFYIDAVLAMRRKSLVYPNILYNAAMSAANRGPKLR